LFKVGRRPWSIKTFIAEKRGHGHVKKSKKKKLSKRKTRQNVPGD